jgi:hypothetical protein
MQNAARHPLQRARALADLVDLVQNALAPRINQRPNLGDVEAARRAVQKLRAKPISSARTCLLTAACDKCSSRAAPEKLCFVTTFAKTPMLSMRSKSASRDLSPFVINHMPIGSLIVADLRQQLRVMATKQNE